MKIQLARSEQRFLFLLGITGVYLLLFYQLDFLRGPYWWDEELFWKTSLRFSDRIIPSLEDLRSYEELNTPLPFIIFGILENLFGQGIVAGRLFNLFLSLAIVFVVGWPTKTKGGRQVLCLIGLLLCPYYLWLSGRLYTEMIACFLVLMGLLTYIHKRYLLSCLAFILAISSRQYMLAFPAAIATYELISSVAHIRRSGEFNWKSQWNWIAPTIAAASILFWLILFGGLAPQTAFQFHGETVPEVQRTMWQIKPSGIVHFLSFVGLYIVIPEFFLFASREKFKAIRQSCFDNRLKLGAITLGLLIFMIAFPTQEIGSGNVTKIANSLPHPWLTFGFYFSLAWIACIRFSKFSLVTLLIAFNALIMVKAYPWDRYVLPMVVAFWYLKSVGLSDRLGWPFAKRLASSEQSLASDLT